MGMVRSKLYVLTMFGSNRSTSVIKQGLGFVSSFMAFDTPLKEDHSCVWLGQQEAEKTYVPVILLLRASRLLLTAESKASMLRW